MQERIARMSENVASSRLAVGEGADDDVALANVDQAFDTILAALAVVDEFLPQIKTASVPEKAAVDAVTDLMDTAIKPYLADALKAMQIFGG